MRVCNQTERDRDTFDYDHANRLRESVIGGVTSTSTYNGDGLRMSLEVDDGSPVTTNYQWDTNRALPVVVNDGTNRYVYGLDLISSIDESNNQSYYTYDGLGSTTDLTDDTGATTDTYSYDVFGAVRDSTGSTLNPWLFTGEQMDTEAGLQYLRARHYDPATGRFLGRNPVLAAEPYAYAGNSPINFVDPTGHHCKAWHPHHSGEIGNPFGDAGQCIWNKLNCIPGPDDMVDCLMDPFACHIPGTQPDGATYRNGILRRVRW